MGIPDYRWLNRVFIFSIREGNLHEDTRSNDRSTWIELHTQRYIETYKIYLRSSTRSISMVQRTHQDNEPQIGIQTIKY